MHNKKMEKLFNIEEYSKDINSILSMKDVEIKDYNKDYVILIDKETGAWATINKPYICVIKKLLENEITLGQFKETFPEHIQLLNLLLNSGVLKVNHVSLLHDKLKKRQCKISKAKICQVVLRYTKNCNLSCSYCYAHTDITPPTSMSNEKVLYILRKLKESYPEKTINLSFHGGEPLFNYNKLVPLVKDIRNISENIKFYIQTNGTLVTKEIANFLKKEEFNVGISIDGFDTESNSHRSLPNGNSSLKQSLIGLDHLLDAGISPGIFTVVTAANQYKLLEHFDFYVNKGIKKFNFSPILHSGKAANKEYNVNIDHLIETNLRLMEKINFINNKLNNIKDYVSEVNISNLINNLSSLNVYNLCTLSPCGAGYTMLGFDIDVSLYSCDYFIGNLDFKIGNIYEIDDIKSWIHKNISAQNLSKRNIDSIRECRICTWKNICTYHCASDSYFNHKTLYKPHSMCEYVKKIIPQIIDLLYRKKISINNIPPC